MYPREVADGGGTDGTRAQRAAPKEAAARSPLQHRRKALGSGAVSGRRARSRLRNDEPPGGNRQSKPVEAGRHLARSSRGRPNHVGKPAPRRQARWLFLLELRPTPLGRGRVRSLRKPRRPSCFASPPTRAPTPSPSPETALTGHKVRTAQPDGSPAEGPTQGPWSLDRGAWLRGSKADGTRDRRLYPKPTVAGP